MHIQMWFRKLINEPEPNNYEFVVSLIGSLGHWTISREELSEDYLASCALFQGYVAGKIKTFHPEAKIVTDRGEYTDIEFEDNLSWQDAEIYVADIISQTRKDLVWLTNKI